MTRKQKRFSQIPFNSCIYIIPEDTKIYGYTFNSKHQEQTPKWKLNITKK